MCHYFSGIGCLIMYDSLLIGSERACSWVLPRLEALQEQSIRKKIIFRGFTGLNEHYQAGLTYLASEGVIENIDDFGSIPRFSE